MTYPSYFISVLVLLLLSACSTVPQKPGEPSDSIVSPPTQGERPEGPLPPSTKPKYNLSGYPANTQQGYIDGCETAKNSGYGFKDVNRYDRDDQYRVGWDDGFALCKGKK